MCLTGQIPAQAIGRGIGYLHELPDQLVTLRSLTRWAGRAMRPDEAPALVNEAFAVMNGGRRGPVSLEMPMDVMAMQGAVRVLPAAARPATPVLDTDRIDDAARMIAAAERPMIVIGGGAADAAEPLLELALAIQAPVVSFRSGRGVVSDRHYLAQVLPAGHELWKTADVAIGIGTRMEQQLLHWRTTPGMKVIRIDIDADEFNRIQPPTVAIHGDAREAIEALLGALRRHPGHRASREQELRQLKGRIAARIASVQPQMAYLRAIREALPDDGFFVDEITQVGYASWYGFPVYAPRHHVNTGYQGTLGFGYATALGVKIANPDCAVVNIAGDGGFLFTSNEMATAAQYNIPLVTVLFNNNRFLNVQRQQNDWFGGRRIGSDLKNPDFIRYAESFGIHAQRVATPEALVTAIRAGLERNAPALIEVPCGDMATPWPHIILPPIDGGKSAARP